MRSSQILVLKQILAKIMACQILSSVNFGCEPSKQAGSVYLQSGRSL